MASPLRPLPAQLSHAARTNRNRSEAAKRERKQRKRKAARANKRARADGDEALPPPATSPSPTSTSSAHAGACAAADFDFEHVDDDVFDYIRDQGAEAALAAEQEAALAAKREATGRAEADVAAWQARAETAAGEAAAWYVNKYMSKDDLYLSGKESARGDPAFTAQKQRMRTDEAQPGYIGVRSRLPSFSYPKVPSSTNCAFELRMCAR